MPRPRGNDWLEDEIRSLQFRGVNYLVCLLENSEIYDLNLEQEEPLCAEKGIDFIHFPIEDVNIPPSRSSFLALTDRLSSYLDQGKKIVIHCRMGIGRSSVLAAAVLIKKGVPPDQVFDIISQSRTLSVPDTEEQREWLLEVAKEITTR